MCGLMRLRITFPLSIGPAMKKEISRSFGKMEKLCK